MHYVVYVVLGVHSLSWLGKIKRNNLTSFSQVILEWRTRKRDMRADRRNHH